MKKVKKITHRKNIKATVVSPEASEDVEGQNASITTAKQQAPIDVQRSTAEAASQTVTATARTKVYQKQAAKKKKEATVDILQATKSETQATAVSMQAAAPPKQRTESATKNAVVIGQEKHGGKGSAAQSDHTVLAEKTEAKHTRQQSRESGATHQLCNVQDKIQGKATAVLKEATPALNQATTEPDAPQSTQKPPVVPTKQACSEQRKQISFDDVRGIKELLEKCISPGSTPLLVRSKSAGTIPVIRASPDLNLAASKEAINSGEETPSLQRSKFRSIIWDDYCQAPPFDLGIDEMVEKKGVEGNATEHKGMTKDKGVANVPATADIEWGIDWGNLDFNQVVEVAVKSPAADGAGRMSPFGFSTPTEDAKKPGEGE